MGSFGGWSRPLNKLYLQALARPKLASFGVFCEASAMKDLALEALDAVTRRGVTYADVRAIEIREREITTKNGKPGHVASSESLGLGIRVLAFGCWGFAATDDLTPAGIEKAAGLALEIARASTAAHKGEVILAPENRYEAT